METILGIVQILHQPYRGVPAPNMTFEKLYTIPSFIQIAHLLYSFLQRFISRENYFMVKPVAEKFVISLTQSYPGVIILAGAVNNKWLNIFNETD